MQQETLIEELDEDFIDCVKDFMAMFYTKKDQPSMPKSEMDSLNEYTKILLSRWARRTARLYTVADSFAAAAVGARRFLQHSGAQMSDKNKLIETQLAYNLAELAVESNHIKWRNANGVNDSHGRFLNIPGNSKEARIISVERLKVNYIHRAEIWSPAHATKASEASKKMKKRRSKFLSVFMEAGNSGGDNWSLTSAKIQQGQPNREKTPDFVAIEESNNVTMYESTTSPPPSPGARQFMTKAMPRNARDQQPDNPARYGDEYRRRYPEMGGYSPGSPGGSKGRRGSAEALLQSVLDECESLIDGLK